MRLWESEASATLLRPFQPVTGRALYVGLSGGIGTGKTTIAKTWSTLGAHVFSADELAREVVQPGTPGLAQVRRHFGDQVLQADGTLDRYALGQIIFNNEDARKTLEAITHPLIAERANQLVKEAPEGSVAVYDVPLLVEVEMAGLFDVVAMVHAPLDVRLARLKRRGLDADSARQRIAAQATVEQREAVTNIWINNDGTSADLRALSEAIYDQWLLPAASRGAEPK